MKQLIPKNETSTSFNIYFLMSFRHNFAPAKITKTNNIGLTTFMIMNLQIADWDIQINMTLPSLIAYKYAPFYNKRQKTDAENFLFTLSQGEITLPQSTNAPIHKCANGTEWEFYPKHDGIVVKLYMQMSGRTYWIKADMEWKKIVTDWEMKYKEDAWALDNIIMLSFIASSSLKNTVLIHSSCIKTLQGDGVAFIGHSNAGKSTHSQLWLQYVPKCTLLNDDQPAIRISEDNTPYIYGTPWSGKGACYKQDKVKLTAIFLMIKAPVNKLITLNSIKSYTTVLSSVSVIKEIENIMKGILNTTAVITQKVNVYNLENGAGKEAVALSAKELGITI